MEKSDYLLAAVDAARAAEAVIRRYYRQGVDVRLKDDQSPVTVADVKSEEAIRQVIARRFPDHGFYGEETGRENTHAEHVWLVDPIDGTKSFVRGYPFFSTQIALMRGDELILGVSNAPEFAEMAWAERGGGAWLNGEPVAVSAVSAPQGATLSTGNLSSLAADARRWAGLGRLVTQVDRTRGYGDFYHYHLLASGRLDLVLESDVNILDVAALSVIVEEAGGRFTELDGSPLSLQTRSVLAAASGALHERALAVLEARG